MRGDGAGWLKWFDLNKFSELIDSLVSPSLVCDVSF